jgi:hypothetical protein
MKQWYETLFENYGQKYDSEIFTQGTIGECDLIEQEIGFNKSIKILDPTRIHKPIIKEVSNILKTA